MVLGANRLLGRYNNKPRSTFSPRADGSRAATSALSVAPNNLTGTSLSSRGGRRGERGGRQGCAIMQYKLSDIQYFAN